MYTGFIHVSGVLAGVDSVCIFLVVVAPSPGEAEAELDPAEEEAYFQSQLAQ